MGLSRGEGEDIRKKKGCSCLERKKEFQRGKKIFFWERGMGALFRKRCLDNARKRIFLSPPFPTTVDR